METTPQQPSFKPSAGSRVRFRRCIFTLNNYTPEEVELVKQLPVQWMVFGRETAPVTGTPHLQGAFVIGKQLSQSTIKKWPGFGRAHFSNMDGTPQQNLKYCSKQDLNFFEKGIMPQEGKRNDLQHAVTMVRGAATMRQLAQDEHAALCVVKYSKGLTLLRSLLSTPRKGPPKILWFHGPTGTGKTRAAVELADRKYGHDESYWISNGSLRWFDGYDGQPMAILDDFRTNHCSFSYLLRILDRYPVDVEFKGGWVKFSPHVIIITAPYSPERMFNLKNEGDVQQLTRRLMAVVEFGSVDDYDENLALVGNFFGLTILPDPVLDLTPPQRLNINMNVEEEHSEHSVECSGETTEDFLE